MEYQILTWDNLTALAVPATNAAQPPPTANDAGVGSGPFAAVLGLVHYLGPAQRCNLRLWLYDDLFGGWYAGASTDELDPLNPTGAPIDSPEGRQWWVGVSQRFTFRVEDFAGDQVEVYARGLGEARG